jgi:hypothetical protein
VYDYKRRAYEGLKTGCHYPNREEWFKQPRNVSYDQAEFRPFFDKPPELTQRQRQLYGLEKYPANNREAATPTTLPNDKARVSSTEKAGQLAAKRVLFVGNSMTYQPKEIKSAASRDLMGLPAVVEKVCRGALGQELICESLTKGGASLMELQEDFQKKIGRSEVLDVAVLQAGCGVVGEGDVLRYIYGPLLYRHNPKCRVILYDLTLFPGKDLVQADVDVAARTMDSYREALLQAGISDVCVANVGLAWRAVREDASADRQIFPALFKDDMQHPSALGGLLNGSMIALSMLQAAPERSLTQVLEAILPAFWRTGSVEFRRSLGVEPGFGVKMWSDSKQHLTSGLIEDDDDEDARQLSKYPPGTRTEKRDLGVGPCDAIATAALATANSGRPAAEQKSSLAITQTGDAPAAVGEKKKRWGKK